MERPVLVAILALFWLAETAGAGPCNFSYARLWGKAGSGPSPARTIESSGGPWEAIATNSPPASFADLGASSPVTRSFLPGRFAPGMKARLADGRELEVLGNRSFESTEGLMAQLEVSPAELAKLSPEKYLEAKLGKETFLAEKSGDTLVLPPGFRLDNNELSLGWWRSRYKPESLEYAAIEAFSKLPPGSASSFSVPFQGKDYMFEFVSMGSDFSRRTYFVNRSGAASRNLLAENSFELNSPAGVFHASRALEGEAPGQGKIVAQAWFAGKDVRDVSHSFPSAESFRQSFPHAPQDMKAAQTLVHYNNDDYLLKGFDPDKGSVTLMKDVLRVSHEEKYRKAKPGDLFGSFRVRSINPSGILGTVLVDQQEVELSWPEFQALAAAKNVRGSAFAWPEKVKPVAPSLFSRLFSTPSPRNVPLVGSAGVKRLSSSTGKFPFQLSGAASPAKEVNYEIRRAGLSQRVTAFVPLEKGKSRNEELETLVEKFLERLPLQHGDAVAIFAVTKEPSTTFKGAGGLATISRNPEDGSQIRVIALYEQGKEKNFERKLDTFWHEIGHQIAQKLWRDYRPSPEWSRAATLDGNLVTQYAASGLEKYAGNLVGGIEFSGGKLELAEDFAEGVSAYLSSDGGRLVPGLRDHFAHRFALLDRIFGGQEVVDQVRPQLAARATAAGIAFSTLLMGGESLMVIQEAGNTKAH